MTRDEVIRNIGTIARSGTREFLAAAREAARDGALPPELIGQFGVGFYSAFMVADRIELVTRRAGQDGATRWESTGDGTYTIADAERAEAGTTVTLHLKPADEEHGLRDYTSDAVLREIVKRYSDFVAYPIRIGTGDPINSRKAIWDRPKGEVTDDEYREFYHHVAHDWTAPLRTIPIKLEGTLEAYALLYVPTKPPFDLYSAEMRRGVQLYVKRVFVMDECKDLMPTWLRFVKGVVDAHDLPLNVSREILQKDRRIQVIRKQLVKKVLATLDEMKRDKPDEYLTFWAAFGPVVKEGLLAPEPADPEKLMDLVLAPSTHGSQPTSLADYVSRMKDGQDAIYVLTAPTPEAAARSPLLEGFTAKGYEVLLFSDPVDELWLDRAPTYAGKPLRSIARGDVKLGSDEERKQAEAAIEEKRRALGDLLICLRAHLQDEVKEVRLSSRLTSSPACLVADEHDLTPRMQRPARAARPGAAAGEADPRAQPRSRDRAEAVGGVRRRSRRSAARDLRAPPARAGAARRGRGAPRSGRLPDRADGSDGARDLSDAAIAHAFQPSSRRASSLIRAGVHGGSHTSRTSARATPGTRRTASRTCSISASPRRAGAVNVIAIATSPRSTRAS
jgi:molecular chaperone HtpG